MLWLALNCGSSSVKFAVVDATDRTRRLAGVREIPAGDAQAALDAVESDHPGFKALVLDGEGRQHRFVKLFINEEAIPSDALDTPLGDSDRLEVLAAIAGG